MVIPGLQEQLPMLPHEIGDVAKLGGSKASAADKAHRIEPELRDVSVAFDVDMGRFAAVSRVKEEPLRAKLEDRRH
jgi:hypothetical protein